MPTKEEIKQTYQETLDGLNEVELSKGETALSTIAIVMPLILTVLVDIRDQLIVLTETVETMNNDEWTRSANKQ